MLEQQNETLAPSTSPQVPSPEVPSPQATAPQTLSSTPLADIQAPPAEHIQQLEKVAHDLQRLLGNSENVRLKSEVKDQIEDLNLWTQAYLEGLKAAQKISENAGSTLAEAQKELSMALDDYLRLEGEGGNPPTPQQEKHTENLSKALRRINGLIPVMTPTELTAADPNAPNQPENQPPAQPDLPEMNPVEEPMGNPELPAEIPPVTDPEM